MTIFYTDFAKLGQWDQDDESPDYTAALHNNNWKQIDKAIADLPLDLNYFRRAGILPNIETMAGGLVEQVLGSRDPRDVNATFPARDFSNLTGGATLTPTGNGFALYTASAGALNLGWDLGSLKSKALIILGGLESNGGTEKCGLFAGKTAPPAAGGGALPDGVPADAYMGLLSIVGSGDFELGETDGSGVYSALGGFDDGHSDLYFSTGLPKIHGIALFVDGTNHVQKLFVKYAPGSWVELVAKADTTITQFRYLGIYMDSVGGTPWFNRVAGPIRVFAEA